MKRGGCAAFVMTKYGTSCRRWTISTSDPLSLPSRSHVHTSSTLPCLSAVRTDSKVAPYEVKLTPKPSLPRTSTRCTWGFPTSRRRSRTWHTLSITLRLFRAPNAGQRKTIKRRQLTYPESLKHGAGRSTIRSSWKYTIDSNL